MSIEIERIEKMLREFTEAKGFPIVRGLYKFEAQALLDELSRLREVERRAKEVIEEMKWFDRRGGLAIGMHEALRKWSAVLSEREGQE